MSGKIFCRALLVQTAAVALVSLFLVALPLPDGFFRDFGFVAGPAAWALCAVITARVVSLPILPVLAAALVAGLVGALLSLAGGHWPGVAGGLVVFAAGCAATERSPNHGHGRSARGHDDRLLVGPER